MRCPNCGESLEQGPVCPHCGATAGNGPEAPPPPPPPPGEEAQERVSPDDLAAYVGSKAPFYLPRFKRFFDRGDSFAATWNWPAFFCTFWWLLYRKMYLWALAVFALSMFFSPGHLVLMVLSGLFGNYLYYRQARSRVLETAAQVGSDEVRDELARRGGVHRWVPWVAVAGMLLLIMFYATYAGMAFMLRLGGHPAGGY